MGYDLSKLNNRTDTEKWFHPEIAYTYEPVSGDYNSHISDLMFNPNVPMEQRKAAVDTFVEFANGAATQDLPGNHKIDIPSIADPSVCNHYAYVRFAETNKKKNPVILWHPAGGLYMTMDVTINMQKFSEMYGASVVISHYRTFFDEGGQYPGTIDDLEATYKWIIDNAEEYKFDPERIIILGYSAGSTISLAFCHRLKSKDYYGHMPRGVIVNAPYPDTRNDLPSGKRHDNLWSAHDIHTSLTAWLGYEYSDPSQTPPEAVANFATADDCVGLPPTFIHSYDNDPGVDFVMAYVSKLIQAGTYVDLHMWGGGQHSIFGSDEYYQNEPETSYAARFRTIFDGQIKDCLAYDLRRPWVKELVSE